MMMMMMMYQYCVQAVVLSHNTFSMFIFNTFSYNINIISVKTVLCYLSTNIEKIRDANMG